MELASAAPTVTRTFSGLAPCQLAHSARSASVPPTWKRMHHRFSTLKNESMVNRVQCSTVHRMWLVTAELMACAAIHQGETLFRRVLPAHAGCSLRTHFLACVLPDTLLLVEKERGLQTANKPA